jgi:hypothetical protein
MDQLISKFTKLNLNNQDEIDELIDTLNNLRMDDSSNPIVNLMYQAIVNLSRKTPCRPWSTHIVYNQTEIH